LDMLKFKVRVVVHPDCKELWRMSLACWITKPIHTQNL
jgi:hypothetical protein